MHHPSVAITQGKEDQNLSIKTLFKAVKLRGVLVGPRTLYGSILADFVNIRLSPLPCRRFEQMNRLITATQLRPVIDKVFPFEEYPQALRYLESQKHVGKVVVRVASGSEARGGNSASRL